MSHQLWLGLSVLRNLLFALLFLAVAALGMDVDSLPVWDPSILVRSGISKNVAASSASASPDSVEAHGYKTMQITVGDGGTQVDQELRLAITGRISDSVWIDALLSDVGRRAGDQTTATLREVDQVYFRVESPNYFLHLGDLTWTDSSMGLYSLNRSSLGAMAGARGSFAGGRTEVRGVVGTDEVQHVLRVMNGVSGQREGYSLDESGSYISIVPESENVWLNGVLLKRGEDYIVNYAGGLLDFKGSIVPSYDDEIRVEYDFYEDDNIYTLYGANATYRHPNLYLDISMFQLENDVKRLKRGVWTDEDYQMLKDDRVDDFVRDDSLGELNRPTKTLRAGARMRFQENNQFYADLEIAVNRSDTNTVSDHVGGPIGNAFRWFFSTDSTQNLKHFPVAMEVYGNRIASGFNVSEFQGSQMEWNAYQLQDLWDLAYGNSASESEISDEFSLKDDLLYDELKLKTRLGTDWFGNFLWGYRRNESESWNSSRAAFSLQHRNRNVSSEFSLVRVAIVDIREMERYQAIARGEYLQGFLRPFGNVDVRYTQIDFDGIDDEVVYGKTSGGVGLYFANGFIRESVGGKVAQRRGESYRSTSEWEDSLKSATWLEEANYNSRYFSLSHLLQYEHTRVDSTGSENGKNDENSWVGNLKANVGSEEIGLTGNISYKLGLTEEQIYTAVYKAVAPGTGDVRYDSLTGAYIEGVDNGDFVYEGEGRNDSVGAVLSSEASFGIDFRWSPRVSLGITQGVLHDVTFGGSWNGCGSDTTGRKLYFPPVTASALRRNTSGQIDMDGLVEWIHPSGVSLSYKPGILFDKKISSISYFETTYSHEVEGGAQVTPNHYVGADFIYEDDELSALASWSWNIYDGSVKYRLDFLRGFFIQPLGRFRLGTGSEDEAYTGDGDFRSTLWEGALRVGYNKRKKVDSFANFSIVQTDSRGNDIPYQVMQGYSDGRTYRFEFQLSVELNDFISLGCHYILRFGNSEENIFQKLATEARAVF